jgi:hypothetical protein
MVIFAKTKGHVLPDLLRLSNDIPSHDTFNIVFQSIDCKVFRGYLSAYGKEIVDVLAEKQICFDGKKRRGVSPQSRGNHGLYIVNAWVAENKTWVAENKIWVGQEKVMDKSNELDALPKLIKSLDITDAVATIDAMGCHKHIAF